MDLFSCLPKKQRKIRVFILRKSAVKTFCVRSEFVQLYELDSGVQNVSKHLGV
jgi:hypothetical protein